MSAVASIAMSGMTAAATRMQVAAGNVAGQAVDGRARQAVALDAQAGGGVAARVVAADGPAGDAAFAYDIVQQRDARNGFQANAKTLQAADRMLGSLLDVLA